MPKGPTQTKLSFDGYSGIRQENLNALFGMAIFTSCASFAIFETPEWRQFFKVLGFTPLARHTLSLTILTECYEKVKSDV